MKGKANAPKPNRHGRASEGGLARHAGSIFNGGLASTNFPFDIPQLIGAQRRVIRLWRIPLVEDTACGAGLRGASLCKDIES
jgi:hypothetical protein